jgi:hypothetical protein
MLNRSLVALVVLTAMCGACTSYQKTSLSDIETHPEKFIDEKIRVHFDGTLDSTEMNNELGRSQRPGLGSPAARHAPPDSVVSLRIAAIDYPILSGSTLAEPHMYGKPGPTFPLSVDVQNSRKVEVHGFSPGRTLLLLAGIAVVGSAVYAAVQNAEDEAWDVFAGIFGGRYEPASPSSPPRR